YAIDAVRRRAVRLRHRGYRAGEYGDRYLADRGIRRYVCVRRAGPFPGQTVARRAQADVRGKEIAQYVRAGQRRGCQKRLRVWLRIWIWLRILLHRPQEAVVEVFLTASLI